MVCHLSVCSPAWYLERSWRLRENEREAKQGKKEKEVVVVVMVGVGVRQMTQVKK